MCCIPLKGWVVTSAFGPRVGLYSSLKFSTISSISLSLSVSLFFFHAMFLTPFSSNDKYYSIAFCLLVSRFSTNVSHFSRLSCPLCEREREREREIEMMIIMINDNNSRILSILLGLPPKRSFSFQ